MVVAGLEGGLRLPKIVLDARFRIQKSYEARDGNCLATATATIAATATATATAVAFAVQWHTVGTRRLAPITIVE